MPVHYFKTAVLIEVLLGLSVFLPCSRAESTASSAPPILQTGGVGEFGNLDTFLTGTVPDWPGWNRRFWTDKELWGNQGYIIGGPRKKLLEAGLQSSGASEKLTAIIETATLPEPPLEKVDLDVSAGKSSTHRVVKGECLWYISAYDRIYGNPLKWPLIYKANKDRIKNPDLIYPGQVFRIPRD